MSYSPSVSPKKAQPPARLLTPREAAGRLGVNPDTLAKWADEKRLPKGTVKRLPGPGGHRRYSEEGIERFIASLKEAS